MFRYDGVGSWNQEHIITEDEPVKHNRLGWAVALSGDQLVASSIYHPNTGNGGGALWFFRYDGTSWIHVAPRLPRFTAGQDGR